MSYQFTAGQAGNHDPSQPYWFSYGSGTNDLYWSAWCSRRDIDPSCVIPVGKALLPDMQLAFHYFSGTWDGGALNVVPHRGGVVEGVLCRVTAEGWRALDIKEGVAAGCYERKLRHAILGDGTVIDVITHEVCLEMREEFVAPAPNYLEVCRNGFEANGFNVGSLMTAAEGGYDGALRDLFVYGTLMEGGSNHSLLEEHVKQNGRAANVRGTLHDLCGYPGLTLIDGQDVHGQLFRLNDPAEALITLDQLEGAEFQGAPKGLYRRTILPVKDGDHVTLAWTYVMDGDLDDPVIAGGSWIRHLARGASP